jgi:putative membrane protein
MAEAIMSDASVTLDASTRLAVDRTRLAYERTMMAWVRTATSLISFGFTIYKFFELELKGAPARHPVIGARGFALIMIATGLVALVLSGIQHYESLRTMRASFGPQPRSVAGLVGGLIGLLGILALFGVLVRV